MSWWAWILFWIVFWGCAAGYLAWRCWKLWPHLREFGRTVQQAWVRADAARESAQSVHSVGAELEARSGNKLVHTTGRSEAASPEPLAWERPAADWRAQWRAERRRRRELRLDDHATTWASWRRPVD